MKKIKERFNRKNEILTVLLSISLGFTVFFFTPVELYIRNQGEFLVDFGSVFLPMLLLSLIVTVCFILLLNIMLLIHEALHMIFSRLLTGLLLAVYIQELFFNGSMTSITGDNLMVTGPKEYLTYGLVYIILFVPLILALCKEKHPDKKIFNLGKGYAIPYLASLIFVMQTCGLLSSMAQYGINTYERTYGSYLSYEPARTLSNEKNVIVFLVDRFDVSYMDRMLEEYPELYDEFEGFTFYRNNVSHYANTFPSMASMLTNVYYSDGDIAINYLNKAWSGENFLDELKDDGYRVNLFLDNLTTYNVISDFEERCDNVRQLDENAFHYNYTDDNGIVPTMIRFSFAKLSPGIYKQYFLDGIHSDFSSYFVVLDNEPPEYMPNAVGANTDLKFYDYIVNNKLTAGEGKVFSFIHLMGCHDQSDKIAALYDGPQKTDESFSISTARGCFEIIFEYIGQMKELGIYDDSTIIILGDHGRAPIEIEHRESDVLTSAITTGLMIKPEGADRERLGIDDTAEMSNDYLAASILEYAGIDHSGHGYSYDDIIKNDIKTERYYLVLNDSTEIKSKAFYRITGNAGDLGNWELMDEPDQ